MKSEGKVKEENMQIPSRGCSKHKHPYGIHNNPIGYHWQEAVLYKSKAWIVNM